MRRRLPPTLLAFLVLLVAPGLPACEADAGGSPEGERADEGADTAGTSGGDVRAESAAPRGPGVGEPGKAPPDSGLVRVWYSRDERPAAVLRRVGGAPLTTALHELVAGPTAEERAEGFSSWFSDSTRHVLRRLQLEDGFLVLDFTGLPSLIPGASSSAGSQQLLASLDSTVFQFEAVDSAEYRLDGSCDAFWEWIQRGCAVVRRP